MNKNLLVWGQLPKDARSCCNEQDLSSSSDQNPQDGRGRRPTGIIRVAPKLFAQTGGTRRKIVTSTLVECEMYADAGFEDILYGFPYIAAHQERAWKLRERLEEFHLMVWWERRDVKCYFDKDVDLKDTSRWQTWRLHRIWPAVLLQRAKPGRFSSRW